MTQKDFFEKMYAHHPEAPPSGRRAHIWKRLELDREQAAFQLLDGGGRFLDVGCGEGSLVLLATQKFNEVYGIDIATPRILRAQETAEKLAKSKAHFCTADLSQGIPFDDSFFDAVSCVATLEFISNPIYLLEEFNRVLKTRGVLIIMAANIAYTIRRFRALLGKPPKTSVCSGFLDGGTLHYFTLTSLTALIKEAGFSVVKKDNTGKLWFLRRCWLALLASGIIIKAVKE